MSGWKDQLGDTPFAPKPRPLIPYAGYEPRRSARRSDPDTSHGAGLRAVSFAQRDKDMVLRAHYDNPQGLTDFDLARILNRQQTSVGKRRQELMKDGLIAETPERRPAPSGSASIVWRITECGKMVAGPDGAHRWQHD